MPKRLKHLRWFDSTGNPVPEGVYVHIVNDVYRNEWYYRVPGVVKKRIDENRYGLPAVRVEFIGFGMPVHRTKEFLNGQLSLIDDPEYIVMLKTIHTRRTRAA